MSDPSNHAEPQSCHCAVGKKIAIDQLIYAPIFTCVLYAYLSAIHGDFTEIPAVLSEKVVPTLMANYAVWPLAHALNFYYVPTEQRILYNNFIAVRNASAVVVSCSLD
jgi:protein Mpv17